MTSLTLAGFSAASNTKLWRQISEAAGGAPLMYYPIYSFETQNYANRFLVSKVIGEPGSWGLEVHVFNLRNQQTEPDKPAAFAWECPVVTNYKYRPDVEGSLTIKDIGMQGMIRIITGKLFGLSLTNQFLCR